MKLTDPLPWGLVPIGAVVLDSDGTPRAVLGAAHGIGPSTIYLEGRAPLVVDPAGYTSLVILDDGDAAATLAAAGLNPAIITITEE